MVRYLAARPLTYMAIASVVLFAIGFTLGTMYDGGSKPPAVSSMSRGESLFLGTMPAGHTIEDRRRAARHLAEQYPESPWVIWILAANDPFMWGVTADKTTQALDRAVVAALLEGIPDNASSAVLVATTAHLATSERGRYSHTSGGPLSAKTSEHRTAPIQEVALAVLKQNTGWDYGYDVDRWRQAILDPTKRGALPTASSQIDSDSDGTGTVSIAIEQEAFVNSLGMTMLRIPAGEFVMGSPIQEPKRSDDETQHEVVISKAFFMSRAEVTQRQWQVVMRTHPSKFEGDDLPVESISWFEAAEFCRKLSEREGIRYSLPTEAEWEYACRAGTATEFHAGGDISAAEANFNANYTYRGSASGVFRGTTVPVGTLAVNGWDLHDMHGNVSEWCQDWYAPYPDGKAVDPQGPEQGVGKVVRGGSWPAKPENCRSAARGGIAPDAKLNSVGFRVVVRQR